MYQLWRAYYQNCSSYELRRFDVSAKFERVKGKKILYFTNCIRKHVCTLWYSTFKLNTRLLIRNPAPHKIFITCGFKRSSQVEYFASPELATQISIESPGIVPSRGLLRQIHISPLPYIENNCNRLSRLSLHWRVAAYDGCLPVFHQSSSLRRVCIAFKMADQHALNVKFVAQVEKHPELYNNNLPEYSRRDVVELAWADVGYECNMSSKFLVYL